jgi:hypothetical protein
MHDTLSNDKYNPVQLPLHVQAQINRGKDDLPLFLRVLLVAFVRHENQLLALSRFSSHAPPNRIVLGCQPFCSSTCSVRAVRKEAFTLITNAFREFYSVPFVHFNIIYLR